MLLDEISWETETMNAAKAGRYASRLLTGLGSACRFTPTCSHYAREALEHHGAARAGTRFPAGLTRPRFRTGSRQMVRKQPILRRMKLYRTMIAYSGAYSIEGNKVVHKIQFSSNQAWTGTNQQRFFEVKDNQLVIKTPPIMTKQASLSRPIGRLSNTATRTAKTPPNLRITAEAPGPTLRRNDYADQ